MKDFDEARFNESQDCDFCNGNFTLGDLNACSGDLWLCDSCLKKYLEGAKDASTPSGTD